MMEIDPIPYILRIAPVHQVGGLTVNDFPKDKEFIVASVKTKLSVRCGTYGSADQISRCAQELLFWQRRTALKEGLIRIIAYFEKLLSDNNVRDRLSVPRTALWTHCAPVDFSEFFDRREDRDVRADVFNGFVRWLPVLRRPEDRLSSPQLIFA
ncbi:MAG: hypothetical protein WB422_24315 [Pseudolabrys sp.]